MKTYIKTINITYPLHLIKLRTTHGNPQFSHSPNNILIGTQSKNLSIMLIHPIRNHKPVTPPAATPYSFEKT